MLVLLALHGPAAAQQKRVWKTDGLIHAVVVSGSTVYVGGEFHSITPPVGPTVTRNCIAAIDAVTGAVLDWAPNPSGSQAQITAIVVDGPTVYMAGQFTSCGGQPRSSIAAVDATGLATAWNPEAVVFDMSYPAVDDLLLANGMVTPRAHSAGLAECYAAGWRRSIPIAVPRLHGTRNHTLGSTGPVFAISSLARERCTSAATSPALQASLEAVSRRSTPQQAT
jgi:hypothetical protein